MTQPFFPAGQPSSVNYGSDFDCPGDLNPAMTIISGRIVLSQALYRRAICPRGALPYDPNFGIGIQSWIDGQLSPGDIARKCAQLDQEFSKDERVKSSRTTGVFVAGVLTLTTIVTDRQGPFTMVIAVSSVTTQLLTPAT